MHFLLFIYLLVLLPMPSLADSGAEPSPYTLGTPSRDGIGKFYMGREISHVMGHRGAAWLERADREREERTDLLIARLPVAADDNDRATGDR